MPLLVIFALVIALGAIIFAFQNASAVAINLIIWHFEESLAIVLLVTLILGVIVGLLLSIPSLVKTGWKSSGQRKTISNLESRLYEQSQTISQEEREYQQFYRSTQDLLKALLLTDPLTDLLARASLEQVIDYQIHKMKENGDSSNYISLCIFSIEVELEKLEQSTSSQSFATYLIKSCAATLKEHVLPRSLLYYDDDNQGFLCLTPGLKAEAASDYGESLCNLFEDFPVKNSDGSIVNLKTSIGGVIAYPRDVIDSGSLLQKLQQAQEQVKRKNRNHFVLLKVTD